MFRTIRVRIFFTYLFLILFTTTLMGSLFFYLTRGYFLKKTESKLANDAEVFLKFVEPYLNRKEDLVPVARFFVRQFWEQMDYGLRIVDKTGRIVFDSRETITSSLGKAKPETLKALEGAEEIWIEAQLKGRVMHRCSPVLLGSEIVGALDVSVSLNELDSILKAMRRFFLLTFALAVLMAILVALFFIKTLMYPIASIRDTASKIARGNLDSRVAYNNPDELGALGKTINFMAEELRKLENTRAEFFSNVTHELKTPLTIIKGFVITLLGDPDAKPEQKRALDLVNRETDRLSRLVDDLLELSRLRSKRVPLQYTNVDTTELVNATILQLSPWAEACQIRLALECDPVLPNIHADADRLKGVIINLVDNAFKYTPSQGEVTVKVKSTDEQLVISVRDTGIGIPESEIPMLFERFFRSEKSKRYAEGTGIGLSIVKEVVEAHGGKINVESKEGHGTTFTVRLPLKRKEANVAE